jgi:alpha-N-acetylglucosaminidase
MKKFLMIPILILIILIVPWMAIAFPVCATRDTAKNEKVVYELIKRVLPKEASRFTVSIIPKEEGKDVFELESSNGRIHLSGNNGISIASALNFYLKNYAHCDITWNGTNLRLPHKLPVVPVKVHQVTPYKLRYYLNYCTFNYTMSWWNWDRWQWEIDWMALNGINMPLALTGQNAIWKRVYTSLGFTEKDLSSFFSGPAYFNWFWMGNLDGWGGPLPSNLIKAHEELQKKILDRERGLGMTPVLPAFTGHVPPCFKEKFPNAALKKTSWVGFPEVYILDPDDSLFSVIGKRFLQEEVHTFGTDHLYSADTFNENTPPSSDSSFLNNISKNVYQSMSAVDPMAIWVMQGWLFHFSTKFWQPVQIKALLNAVPNNRMIILDLWSEKYPEWSRTNAYYGKSWIWCMLHNFGGNINMYGMMKTIAKDPALTLQDVRSGNMEGIGLTPEGIEQNPVIYELMLENVWRKQPVPLQDWLKGYLRRRYGKYNKEAEEAWTILKNTVYNDSITSGGPRSIITGRPTFERSTAGTITLLAYRPGDLLPAWDEMIRAAKDLKESDGFQYDLVDLTRQVMANYADVVQQQFATAYRNRDSAAFKKYSGQFIELITDMDILLATRKDFLLGKWLDAAKSWGFNDAEKKLYERNARDLITLWGDKNSRLHEYACKQWSGMLNGFYKQRWELFFDYVISEVRLSKEVDQKYFDGSIKNWEWQWVNGTEIYKDKPQGDPVIIAQKMYRKYKKNINKAY